MTKIKSFWNKFWYDKNGKLAVVQFPNVPLSIWLACTIIAKVISEGRIYNGLSFLGTAALIVWAYLEIISGSSYFRRLLGATVLTLTLVTRFK